MGDSDIVLAGMYVCLSLDIVMNQLIREYFARQVYPEKDKF